MSEQNFSLEDIQSCWQYADEYLLELLNEEYSVESAIEDLKSLIGSKWDTRTGEKL